jgi:hypothetical protein
VRGENAVLWHPVGGTLDTRAEKKERTAPGKFEFIYPKTLWQRMVVSKIESGEFTADEVRFYVNDAS